MPSDNSNLYENICDKLNSIISFKNNIKGYMETYISTGNPTGIHDLSEISEDKSDNELLNKGYLPDYNILLKDYLNAKYIPEPSLLSKARLNTDNSEIISRSLEYLINFKGDSSVYINGINVNLLKGSTLLSDYDFAINDLLLGEGTEIGDDLKHQLMMVGGPGFINSEDITIEGFSSFSECKNYIFNYPDPFNDGQFRRSRNIKNLDLLNGQGILNIAADVNVNLKPVKRSKNGIKQYRYIFIDYINYEAGKIIEETDNNIIKQRYSVTTRAASPYATSYTYNFEDSGLYYGNNILELKNGKYVWKSENFKWKAIPVKYYNETIFDEDNQLINYEQDRCAISYGSNKTNMPYSLNHGFEETDIKFRDDLLSFINTHPELASEHTQYKLIKIAETHEFRKISMLTQAFIHSAASVTKTIDNVSFAFPTPQAPIQNAPSIQAQQYQTDDNEAFSVGGNKGMIILSEITPSGYSNPDNPPILVASQNNSLSEATWKIALNPTGISPQILQQVYLDGITVLNQSDYNEEHENTDSNSWKNGSEVANLDDVILEVNVNGSMFTSFLRNNAQLSGFVSSPWDNKGALWSSEQILYNVLGRPSTANQAYFTVAVRRDDNGSLYDVENVYVRLHFRLKQQTTGVETHDAIYLKFGTSSETINFLNPPTLNPPSGEFNDSIEVSISHTNGADTEIYYTIDNSNPTDLNGSRIRYTGNPIQINSTTTIKAVVSKVVDGETKFSSIVSGTYTKNTNNEGNENTSDDENTTIFYVDVSTRYKNTNKNWETAVNGIIRNFHYGDVSILDAQALTGYTLSLSNPSLDPNNINTTSVDISVNFNPSDANDLTSEYEWDVSILTPQYISLKKKELKKFTINILSSSEEHTASLFVYNTHNPSIKSSPFNLNVQSDLWSGNNGLIHLKFRIIIDGFFGNSTDGKYGSFDWGRDGGSSSQWKEIKLFFGNGTASSVSNRPIYRCKIQEPNGEQRIFELSFKQLYEMWHKTAYTGSTALNLHFNTGNSTTPSRIIIAPSQTTGNINLENEPKLGVGYMTYPNITNNPETEYNNFENRYTPSKIIVPFKPHDSYKTSLFIVDPSVFEKTGLQPYNYVIGSNGSDISDPTGFHIPVPSTATATNNVIFIPTGSDLNLNEIQIRTERYSSTSNNPVKQEYRLSYILYKVRKQGGAWNGYKIIPGNKFNSGSDYNYTFTGIKNDYSPEICIDLVFNHQYNTGGYGYE